MLRRAFTLIELLVVIAIVAILSVVLVLTLNPTELLRQARDANRLSDMSTIASGIGLYTVQQGGSNTYSLGSSSVVYVSIPDPAATSPAGDQCQGLNLQFLPSNYSYHCAASSTYKNVDGTGWIPVNFNALTGSSPMGSLPIDPINISSTGEYYTYMTNGTTYEITAALESQKYLSTETNDGGQYTDLYEQGTNKTLAPVDFTDVPVYSLTIGGPSAIASTTTNGASATLTFAGMAGQEVTVSYTPNTSVGCVGAEIINPNGTVTLQNNGCATNNSPAVYGPYILPLSGVYSIVMTSGGNKVNETVQLTLNGTINVSNTLTIGGASSTQMATTVGASTTFAFAGTAGQQVTFSYTPNTTVGCVDAYIVNPDTTITLQNNGCATNNSPATYGPYTLPLTGSYDLVLTSGGNYVNETAQLTLNGTINVSNTLTIGGASSTLITTTGGASAAFTFAGSSGQSIHVAYGENINYGCVSAEIINPDTTVTLENDNCATNNGPATKGPYSLPQNGTYTILITPHSGNLVNQTAQVY